MRVSDLRDGTLYQICVASSGVPTATRSTHVDADMHHPSCDPSPSPPPLPAQVDADAAVAIYCEGKEHAVALGLTKMSTQDIRTINKGIGVDNVHYLNDGLWKTTSLA